MTHSYAILEVSASTYGEIEKKLREAGYDHAFDDGAIDMHGIALTKEEPYKYCVTTADGDCVSTDPRCMHQPRRE